MVGTVDIYKKRQNIDINDLNFVASEQPTGINAFGFPVFPTIIDFPDYIQTTFSLDHYLQPATLDVYGMFFTSYLRPGARKFRQTNVELILEQKTNAFVSPALFMSFFGVRPVFYDPRTNKGQNPQPIYDHFNLFSAQNDKCIQLSDEMHSNNIAGIPSILESVFAIPPPIVKGGGDYQRRHIMDMAMPIAFRTSSISSVGQKTYSTHNMLEELNFSFPDIFSVPQGIVFEIKLQVYCFRLQYPDSAINSLDPQLIPILSDDIVSFSGIHEVI